jgi:hypothetical protein
MVGSTQREPPVNGYILWAMLGIMILGYWMMTLVRFIKKKSCHPLLSSILVLDSMT